MQPQTNLLPDGVAARKPRSVRLLGVASAMGATQGGCELAPTTLQSMGLAHRLQARGIDTHWWRNFDADICTGETDVDAVASLYRWLSGDVAALVRNRHFFAVLDGDHSCAIGTWSGACRAVREQNRALGLIWVDAHMDSHVPATSPSGALHGMPLACLLGYGPRQLTGIAQTKPVLQPGDVCLIGVRSYESEEADLLQTLGVRVVFMDEVERRGLAMVFEEAVDRVSAATRWFGLSIDLDVLDPDDAPGVTVPVPGGLRKQQLVDAVHQLQTADAFLGMELAEYNPRRDLHGKTGLLIEALLAAAVPAGTGS